MYGRSFLAIGVPKVKRILRIFVLLFLIVCIQPAFAQNNDAKLVAEIKMFFGIITMNHFPLTS